MAWREYLRAIFIITDKKGKIASPMKLQVLYEDNHCIVVVKPAGLLTQPKGTDPNLLDNVREHLKEKYKKAGNVFVGLVHRLDRHVGGVMVFAKTSKGASRLSEQFRDHTAQKTYHAIVIGTLTKQSDTLVHYILKDVPARKADIFDEPGEGRQKSELHYEVIKSVGANSLLKIELKTGRFHQIRAQLSMIGHPVLGDTKYGAPAPLEGGNIALQASILEFETPTGGERKKIEIEIPEAWGSH
jgi:23S rRNA pseudouridine1911/1915/1917 synthase